MIHDDLLLGGVSCDSRTIAPEQLFVALPGNRVDGHAFLREVAERGVKAAMVSCTYMGPSYGMELLAVDDTLAALQQMAAQKLQQQRCRVVAVTGSVGKTTTKEFLTTLLAGSFRVACTPGNANSQIGLPLALLNGLRGDEEVVVCEMGMSRAGELSRLVAVAPPYLAIITEVALAHAANFSGLEAIALAKGEILTHPSTELALVNRSIPNYDEVCRLGTCHKLAFSAKQGEEADFALEVAADGSLQVVERGNNLVCLPALALPGRHNAINCMLAAVAARLLGVAWEVIAGRVGLLRLPERRLQYIEKKGVLFINDAYNACLASMEAALQVLPEPALGCRRIGVLGAMLELGDFSASCHRTLGELTLGCIDILLCLGEECQPMHALWKELGRPSKLCKGREELVAALQAIMQPGDVVLLKGSRSKELWKVIDEVN